jgi:hypothetical protein
MPEKICISTTPMPLSKLAQAMKLLSYTWEVPELNLGRDNGNPDVFLDFPQSLQHMSA